MKLPPLTMLLLSVAAYAPAWGAQTSPSAGGYTTARLASLVRAETLGMQLQRFETVAGRAKHVDGLRRTYQVDGCPITIVLTRNSTIQRLGVQATRTCRIPLAPLLGKGVPAFGAATFGDFAKAGWRNPKYEAICLDGCGSSTDPSVYARWTRPSSSSIAIAEVRIISDASMDAHERWKKAVEGGGFEYMYEQRYNTDPKAQAVGHRLFHNIRVTAVTLALPPDDPLGLDYTFAHDPTLLRSQWPRWSCGKSC